MREIYSHRVNGLNEVLKVEAVDGPGSGGASHVYDVTPKAGTGVMNSSKYPELFEDIERLSLGNPTVRFVLFEYLSGTVTWERALATMVQALVLQNKALSEMALDFVMRAPISMVVPKDDGPVRRFHT